MQDALSLGYLYLLAVGIVSDSIFYSYFGIPILRYTDVLDVLLSPLVYLERQPIFFLLIAVTTVATLTALRFQRRRHERRAHDEPYLAKIGGAHAYVSASRRLRWLQFIVPAVTVFAGYVGYAAGAGSNLSDRMRAGTLKLDHRLTMTDGRSMQVRVLGSNSSFAFYVVEGEKRVLISPLKESIAVLEPLVAATTTDP